MNYFIQRGSEQYGPYTLADLQRYLASGNILPTDMARSEGMQDWVPVSQIMGNINPAPPNPAPPSYGQVPQYAQPQPYGVPQVPMGTPIPRNPAAPLDLPPNLHWALLLVIGLFCGLLTVVFSFLQAASIRKLVPGNNALIYYAVAIASGFVGVVASGLNQGDTNPVGGLFVLVGMCAFLGFWIAGIFTLKAGMEYYFSQVVPLNLRLNGVMVFFFNVYYFQYHFNRIQTWKDTGYLPA